jgi:hypothetical protein
MVVEPTHALICFNDSKSPMQEDKGRTFAYRLANNLRGDNIEADIKGYSKSTLPPDSYQWLIFVYEPEATQPPMRKVINDARDLVVRRRMRNVLAVTIKPNDLPPEWASIRKYDVSNPEIESEVLQNIRRDMRYVKIPYSQIQAPESRIPPIPQKLLLHKRPLSITAVLLLLLLITSTALVVNNHNSSIKNAAAAATAITAHAQATQKAARQQIATATTAPQALYNQFFKEPTNRPAISGFDHHEQWSTPTPNATNGTPTPTNATNGTPTPTNQPPPCDFGKHNTYIATVDVKNQYTPCLAQKTNFTDLALQVDMQITGDAGGVIFRSNNFGHYYRVSILQKTPQDSPTASLTVHLCNSDCQDAVGDGTSLTTSISDAALSMPVDPTQPITLSLIIRGNTFYIFINKKFVASVTDPSSIVGSGQIGVYAASQDNPTNVVFSNLKVWTLPAAPTSQMTPTPTPGQNPNTGTGPH